MVTWATFLTPEPGRTARGLLEGEQHPDRGRLSRPVGAEETNHLPGRLDPQAQASHRSGRTVRLAQTRCLDRSRRRRRHLWGGENHADDDLDRGHLIARTARGVSRDVRWRER
jgi:hypothetical protein